MEKTKPKRFVFCSTTILARLRYPGIPTFEAFPSKNDIVDVVHLEHNATTSVEVGGKANHFNKSSFVFLVFYQSAERFAGNMEVRKDDYKSWGVSITE